MIAAQYPAREAADPRMFWLELSFEGLTRTFELPSDETRIIVVGALPSADLRIERPGVAPVHFHLERQDNHVWLVPGYGSETLRVDTARVTGARRIRSQAVIEFCGVQLEATVLESPRAPRPHSSAPRFCQGATSKLPHVAPSRGFENEELGVSGIQQSASTDPATVSMAALDGCAAVSFLSDDLPTMRFAPFGDSGADPIQQTVVIQPVRMVGVEPGPQQERQVPFCAARTHDAEAQPTTAFEPIRISQACFGEGSHAVSYAMSAPNESTARASLPLIVWWLSRVGHFSRRRPLLIWIIGTTIAFVLSATIAYLLKRTRPASDVALGQQATLAPRPLQEASVRVVAPNQSAPPPALVIVPNLPAEPSTKSRKNQLVHPDLVSAVNALISGHYADAQAAYARLSSATPNGEALHVVSDLLERRASSKCSNVVPGSKLSCPEVRQ